MTEGLSAYGSSFPWAKSVLSRHDALTSFLLYFPSTPAVRRDTRCRQSRRHPAFRSSPGGLRRRASVGRQSVSCFHTHSLSVTPTVRSSPRLPLHFGMRAFTAAGPAISAAAFYKRPFIETHLPFQAILFLSGTVTPGGYRREVGIRAYKPRLHGVSARFYRHAVKSS